MLSLLKAKTILSHLHIPSTVSGIELALKAFGVNKWVNEIHSLERLFEMKRLKCFLEIEKYMHAHACCSTLIEKEIDFFPAFLETVT